MYQKIFVALDGSKLSESVLLYARFFAKKLHLPVTLLQVIDPLELEAETRRFAASTENVRRQSPKYCLAYLKQAAETFSHIVPVTVAVETGNPAETILDKVAGEPGALIAIASHGRSGLQRWLLGSVAHKVAAATANPVLLVRASEQGEPGDEAALRTLLVALDGSQLAETALGHAAGLAERMALATVLVRVYDPSIYAHAADIGGIAQELKSEAEEYLIKMRVRFEAGGAKNATHLVLEGSPAAKIAALGAPDGLTLMTTHGISGIRRWLLGSVTERVMRHARGPLLIVRPASAS